MVDVDDTTLAILYQNKDTTFAAPSKRFLLAKLKIPSFFFGLLVVLVFLESSLNKIGERHGTKRDLRRCLVLASGNAHRATI